MWDHLEVDYLYLHRRRGKEWWIEIEANNYWSFYSCFLLKTTLHTVLRYLFLRNVYIHVLKVKRHLNIECFLYTCQLTCAPRGHSGQGSLSFMIIHENSRWFINSFSFGFFLIWLVEFDLKILVEVCISSI
jgi:hypothetical protein